MFWSAQNATRKESPNSDLKQVQCGKPQPSLDANDMEEPQGKGMLLLFDLNFMYRVRETVMSMVDDFCLDYLKANQK